MRETNFGRVFSFAAREGRNLSEDYLTEHLALAIRVDPRPFLLACAPKVALPTGALDVETQVTLPDRSRLDLQISRAGTPLLWVEVKAGAGEHGNQLARYESAATSLNPVPVLILLGPASFWPESTLPRIVWSDLLDAVEATDAPSDLWQFVVGAVRYFGLGGGKRMPLNEIEVASPEAVHTAIERLSTFFFELSQELRGVKPTRKWWDNHNVEPLLWSQLVEHQRLIFQYDLMEWDVQNRGDPPMYTYLGVEDGAFIMTLEARPDLPNPDLTAMLGSAILTRLTEAGWERSANPNELKVRYDRPVGRDEQELLVWARSRFAEIETSGAYAVMHSQCREELAAPDA